MERDIDKINADLAEAQWKWYDEVCKPWMENNENIKVRLPRWIEKKCKNGIEEKESISYSEPFCHAVINDAELMFVGQETNGYGSINNFKTKDDLLRSQQWLMNYLEENLDIDQVKNISYNKYPFMEAMRQFSRDYDVCWNNIDKIHYRTDNIKCITLYANDESRLNQGFGEDNCSLLMQEIKIIKPEIIVFAIGRAYKTSLFNALPEEVKLRLGEENMPSKDKLVGKEFSIPLDELNIRCFWTYHPGYYARKNVDPYETIKKAIDGDKK